MISHHLPRILRSILSPKNHSSLNSHLHTFTIQPFKNIFENYAKPRLTVLKMVRKSARGAKSKWPCGNCGFHCNNDAIFCEDCGQWYHVKCENLSSKDFTVLQKLTEEYLCSSCTHTGRQFSYDRALLCLRVSVSNAMLESGVKLESILLSTIHDSCHSYALINVNHVGGGGGRDYGGDLITKPVPSMGNLTTCLSPGWGCLNSAQPVRRLNLLLCACVQWRSI